ncbi:uncharacterized protein SCHCODRAFT_02337330 [Schizophyllum commune H4-8]|uniref:uncharacterized protein n=1 Tax=Schizophyllum commune (strain H4-8 / FGSC 9210) TaxID=578458 RepID=UPI0021603922|nr:uncharacterized protein SCHCODRAFT_02337330 [Schizophyllum commune H4-8]KAI5890154.1 hypothetical protein SCHCODRAFT_02337330 [Schizophyllum commune H4-8]
MMRALPSGASYAWTPEYYRVRSRRWLDIRSLRRPDPMLLRRRSVFPLLFPSGDSLLTYISPTYTFSRICRCRKAEFTRPMVSDVVHVTCVVCDWATPSLSIHLRIRVIRTSNSTRDVSKHVRAELTLRHASCYCSRTPTASCKTIDAPCKDAVGPAWPVRARLRIICTLGSRRQCLSGARYAGRGRLKVYTNQHESSLSKCDDQASVFHVSVYEQRVGERLLPPCRGSAWRAWRHISRGERSGRGSEGRLSFCN